MRNLGCPDQIAGYGGVRHMQGDDIRTAEQLLQARGPLGVAKGELVDDVMEADRHAQTFEQHRDLGADMAVADDAHSLAADLGAAGGALEPLARMGGLTLLRDAPHQHDDLPHHQLRDAAGIAVGCIEDRNAGGSRRFEIDLIGADTKGPDHHEIFHAGDRPGGHPGLRADAQYVDIGRIRTELVNAQGALEQARLQPRPLHLLHRCIMDVFQQQHIRLDLLLHRPVLLVINLHPFVGELLL
ncbi:MAG: hypothetical protein BWY77_00588 [bacterium ADurb.Bin431]|nr:MAG: hypothetical protein BWY77_00588 [bacterium ADurb.Bin431]